MIGQNLNVVSERIQQACLAVKRTNTSVKLLAVSKTFGIDSIREAFAWGQHDFGENYVQEAQAKISVLQSQNKQLKWHFIGALQSNKTKQVAQLFDWVHSVSSASIAIRLNEQRPTNMSPLNVLIQVNTSQESTKNGVADHEVAALSECMLALPRLRLRGLMGLPAPTDDPMAQQFAHKQLRLLFDALRLEALVQKWPYAQEIDTLSMGMSADLEAAIAEGSTLVRIGTAIFGQRKAPIASS